MFWSAPLGVGWTFSHRYYSLAFHAHRGSDFRCSSLQLILLRTVFHQPNSLVLPPTSQSLPAKRSQKGGQPKGICSLVDVSYNNIKRITRMRARSGAIHSDSEESFTQLAEISVNQTGIFYDEKLNRRIRAHLAGKGRAAGRECGRGEERRGAEGSKPKNSFLGFDFDIEFEVVRQEREELERMKQLGRREVNIAVLTESPRETVEHLRAALGEAAPFEYSQRGVDLVVNDVGSTIFKYWVFSDPSSAQDDPILSLYLNRCALVLQVSHSQASFLKCNVESRETKERILSNLTY